MGFAADVEKFAMKVGSNSDKVLREVALQMGTSVVVRSPVDTGRFRMNWNFSVDVVDTSKDLESPPTKDIGFAMSKLQAAVSGFSSGHVLNVVNNLDYAIPLEFGSSEQAPAGMVRITVSDFQKHVKKALRNLR